MKFEQIIAKINKYNKNRTKIKYSIKPLPEKIIINYNDNKNNKLATKQR